MEPGPEHPLVTVYLSWTWLRAVLHNGWWLLTGVYLVADAHLTAAQLVAVGVLQSAVALAAEIPAGVLADSISRKWSLIVSQVLMGGAMLATALVDGFWPIAATQMVWGLSWTFASGADVAWITDELNNPERVDGVLVRSGQTQLTGAAAGLVAFGLFGSVVGRSAGMVAAGVAMLLLGLYVLVRFPETRFVPAPIRQWTILRDGWTLVRRSHTVRFFVMATILVNGADTFGRIEAKALVNLGFPANPVAWFTGLGVASLLIGVLALKAIKMRIHNGRRAYAIACAAGTLGVAGLAVAPDPVTGCAAVLVAIGIARPLTRTIGTILVNRETPDVVRATVHSFLAQGEYAGEIVCGLAVAAVAAKAGIPWALAMCAALYAITAALAGRSSSSPRPASP